MRRILLRPSRTATAKHKVIIIDEADNTTNDVQPSYGHLLRSLVATADSSSPATTKTKSSNPFIPVAVVEFSITGKQKPGIAAKFFSRLQSILTDEGIKFDNKVLVELINKHFPDWRRVLNECQRYSVGGEIDTGILASFAEVKTDELIKNLKEKNFPEVRKWVVSNLDNDSGVLLRRVYDACYETLDGPSIAAAVLIVAKYQYQAALADQEINLLAALTEIMVECNFK